MGNRNVLIVIAVMNMTAFYSMAAKLKGFLSSADKPFTVQA
ncbi:hypothetical protein [Yersinia pekkanenii]|nr:hypothetical protein [Yersinia pekkanenii]